MSRRTRANSNASEIDASSPKRERVQTKPIHPDEFAERSSNLLKCIPLFKRLVTEYDAFRRRKNPAGTELTVKIDGKKYVVDLQKLQTKFTAELKQQARIYKAAFDQKPAKRGGGRSGEQLLKSYFISDQYAKFFGASNFGNGLFFGIPFYPGLNTDEKIRLLKLDTSSSEGKAEMKKFVSQDLKTFIAASNEFEAKYTDLKNKQFKKKNDEIDEANKNRESKSKAQKHTYVTAETNYDGYKLADFEKLMNLKEEFSLVINDKVLPPSSGISILSHLTILNGEKSSSNPTRTHPTDALDALNASRNRTKWVLNGVTKSGANVEKLADKDAQGTTSLYDRLSAAKTKSSGGKRSRQNEKLFIAKGDQAPGTDDYGLIHTVQMILNSYYTIPHELLTDDESAQLNKLGKSDAAANITSTLNRLTFARSVIYPKSTKAKPKPAKSNALTRGRQASASQRSPSRGRSASQRSASRGRSASPSASEEEEEEEVRSARRTTTTSASPARRRVARRHGTGSESGSRSPSRSPNRSPSPPPRTRGSARRRARGTEEPEE